MMIDVPGKSLARIVQSKTGMRTWATLLLNLAIAAAPVFPQTPAKPDKPPPMVLVGCLKSSGADTAVAGPSGRIYSLEVTDAPAPSTTTSAMSNPPVATKTTYSLAAAESLGFAKHVDHEVELTGSLQPASTAPEPTAPGAARPKPGGAHRTFEVTAVKMLASKCR